MSELCSNKYPNLAIAKRGLTRCSSMGRRKTESPSKKVTSGHLISVEPPRKINGSVRNRRWTDRCTEWGEEVREKAVRKGAKSGRKEKVCAEDMMTERKIR